MDEKVSIIMGVFNCSETLEEAIDSILNQTYTDWKFIICDDGSTDNTFQIIKEYQKRYSDKFVILKNEKNMGLNYTLNRCLKEAKGEYVARMDGDDISLPERLKKEVEFLESHSEYAIVSTPMIFFDENGEWKRGKTKIVVPKIRDFVFNAPFHCHAPCMIRRKAFMAVNGYTVDKRLLRYEDCNLWYKLYAAGYQGYNLQEPLYMMRDDRNAYKRRTIESRMRAVYVQWVGFKMVHMPLKYYPYLVIEFLKSVIIVILPEKIYNLLHRR